MGKVNFDDRSLVENGWNPETEMLYQDEKKSKKKLSFTREQKSIFCVAFLADLFSFVCVSLPAPFLPVVVSTPFLPVIVSTHLSYL